MQKKTLRRRCCSVYFILSILFATKVQAQETHHIYFRFDRSDVDTTFRENRISTTKLINLITCPGIMIDSVDIHGYASPDGGHRRNRTLSKERALSARDFLLQHSPDSLILNSTRIRIHPMRENWAGLEQAVVDGYIWQNKDKVLRIIRKEGIGECTRENMIKDLDKGYTWWLLKKHFMADLRIATVITLYTTTYPNLIPETPAVVLTKTRFNPAGERQAIYPDSSNSNTSREDGSQKVFMSLRTNMLYDLAMTPNIGVDFNLGKGWAIGASWAYAWWKSDPRSFYWRLYGGEVNFRKYFGKAAKERTLSGHHLGIYAQGLTYDLELGKTGILSQLSYGGGIEYGYSLPVARTLNIDFSIGAGYLGGEYKVYDPIDEHYVWRETRQRHWLGPTKAEISLVWLIGNKAFRKGGEK